MIGGEQVLVGVLGTGVGGHQLSSSFQRRGEKEYMDELGHTLVQLCSIIPSGVLVFFASYGMPRAATFSLVPHGRIAQSPRGRSNPACNFQFLTLPLGLPMSSQE